MPFTVSHIVAALPLNKRLGKRFSKYTALSPLVIGSMTPDVAYLTPFLVHQRVDSHSLIGIYLFCIPMGLTIYFLYHLLMAPVWVSLLPRGFKARLNPDLALGKLPDISSHVLLISLILGAITHIIWDYFTHLSGIPQLITAMSMPLMTLDGYDIMPYRVLQHLSSIIGLVLLMYIIYRWYRDTKIQNNIKSKIPQWLKVLTIISLFVISTIVAVLYAFMYLPETDVLYGLYSAQIFLKIAIIVGASIFLLNSAILGLLFRYVISKG